MVQINPVERANEDWHDDYGINPVRVGVEPGSTVTWTNTSKVEHNDRGARRIVEYRPNQAGRVGHAHLRHGRDLYLHLHRPSLDDRAIRSSSDAGSLRTVIE